MKEAVGCITLVALLAALAVLVSALLASWQWKV